jgi:hypothetical protein
MRTQRFHLCICILQGARFLFELLSHGDHKGVRRNLRRNPLKVDTGSPVPWH